MPLNRASPHRIIRVDLNRIRNLLVLARAAPARPPLRLRDGRVIAAAQEERFTRKKHDPRFPKNAIGYCLEEADISIQDLSYIVFYDKPFLTFERLLLTYLTVAPRGLRSWLEAMPLWLGQKLYLPRVVRDETGYGGRVLFREHHEAHAASAFYPSPFESAAILTVDGGVAFVR